MKEDSHVEPLSQRVSNSKPDSHVEPLSQRVSNSKPSHLPLEKKLIMALISPVEMKAGSGENGHVSVLGHFPSLEESCQASGSSVWAGCMGSPQGVGSRNAVAGWAHRNPGLNSLRQHLCSSKSWRPGLLSKLYQPPFLPPSSYAAVLMSGISPGGMAKEGFEDDGWRMADRRHQPFPAAHRGRSSSAGRWAFRGRVARGRDSWRSHGGRAFGAGGSDAPFDREPGDSSREVGAELYKKESPMLYPKLQIKEKSVVKSYAAKFVKLITS